MTEVVDVIEQLEDKLWSARAEILRRPKLTAEQMRWLLDWPLDLDIADELTRALKHPERWEREK